MVTKEEFDSYEECAESQGVVKRGPKKCGGREKRRRQYKWRLGLKATRIERHYHSSKSNKSMSVDHWEQGSQDKRRDNVYLRSIYDF